MIYKIIEQLIKNNSLKSIIYFLLNLRINKIKTIEDEIKGKPIIILCNIFKIVFKLDELILLLRLKLSLIKDNEIEVSTKGLKLFLQKKNQIEKIITIKKKFRKFKNSFNFLYLLAKNKLFLKFRDNTKKRDIKRNEERKY